MLGPMLDRAIATLVRWLSSPRAPLAIAVVTALLYAPSLFTGLQIDDYFHHVVLDPKLRLPGMVGAPWDAFTFVADDPAARQALRDHAYGPWWASPDLALSFFRPLSSLTHALDHAAWPGRPWIMHIESLFLYGALVAAAGAVYRRVLGAGWIATLAVALYALDDAHAMPVAWIANRNALLAAAFGVLALLAHDRARRDGSRSAAVIGPTALALALCSGESAVGIWGYLIAYAVVLDPAPRARRWVALAPYAVVTIAWRLAYRALGHGVRGSGLYLDPAVSPLAFAKAALVRAPVLLASQLGVVPSDATDFVPTPARVALLVLAVALLAFVGWAIASLLRRDPNAQFFALGLVLSIGPSCAVFPMDRLLLLAGLGGMGLVAIVVGEVARARRQAPRRMRALAGGLLLAHAALGPLLVLPRSLTPALLGRLTDRALRSAPSDAAIAGQTVAVVNAIDVLTTCYLPVRPLVFGAPAPRRVRSLGVSAVPLRATRVDATTLRLRAREGLFGTPTDPMVRDDRPFGRGERHELLGMRVEIIDVTADGRPAEILYRFDVPLEDPSLRWITWHAGRFVAYRPPALGESNDVEAAVPTDLLRD
jgi:hypothetical protein